MTAVAGAPAVVRRSWPGVRARRTVGAVVALAVAVGVLMAATGWGTGDGPLGLPDNGSAMMQQTGSVGSMVIDGGASGVANHGWFDATIEQIRPIPVDGAQDGMPVESVRLTHWAPQTDANGQGYYLPGEPGESPRGFVVHPIRHGGRLANAIQVVVHYRLAAEGVWRYQGYEVTYRSGLVKHRMVVPFSVVGCAPQRTTPGCT